mmetsp:Transcript_2248/g.3523  ORF Transcript_2248/g.3523 Transcript_2248/m.3523 type:complete len:167 (-) Transcript_2248:152-652(-)
MTIKDDPPIVHAHIVADDPEIDLTEPSSATASMVGVSTKDDLPPNVNPAYVPAAAAAANYNDNNQTTTTTTTTTTYIVPPAGGGGGGGGGHRGFGRDPCATTCPNCNQQTRTRVTHTIDSVTILAVVLLLLFFWPLFWLPLVIPSCKSSEHYCRNCNYRIAKEDAC